MTCLVIKSSIHDKIAYFVRSFPRDHLDDVIQHHLVWGKETPGIKLEIVRGEKFPTDHPKHEILRIIRLDKFFDPLL